MISFAVAIQFILAIILTIAVMLQKSSSIGLGAYSGSNESVFGAKGPAGFLSKATFIIGLLFIVNTVFLTYSFNKEKNKSVIDTVKVLTPTQNMPVK
ncbi:MAG: preprotein translocase subunit SecG [Campylobacterales bacterium]|mgnify:CR=1 FL=1|nr:preprotein translocase subunit SecG [Campylobacterales bacterium]